MLTLYEYCIENCASWISVYQPTYSQPCGCSTQDNVFISILLISFPRALKSDQIMRLLELKDGGEFGLVEFFSPEIPRYAILSHTWGTDGEEVTFKDIRKGTGKSKAGYQKIHFCGKQAAADGLQYFWVDTCCIDKSSSAELSEAINSMFRWYHDAHKCYVYLSDVSISSSIENDQLSQQTSRWEPTFRKSRWFTRGWTLQELIAPASVEFFSVEGERLGDKKSLGRQIYEITGIALQALQGCPLSYFSVNERMSWATRRETKREEDAVYSLLGVFDIHMPLIYGEGRKKALIRLEKEIMLGQGKSNTSPKRGLSAYMFFANENREKLREENLGIKFGTTTCSSSLLRHLLTRPFR